MNPKISGAVPQMGTKQKLDKQYVEVPEWKRSGYDMEKDSQVPEGPSKMGRAQTGSCVHKMKSDEEIEYSR